MDNNKGIYDARPLGAVKMGALGFQHLFSMFGATVIVPVISGLSVSATLFFAGFGTLIFHFITKRKVPAFLGSSFTFVCCYQAATASAASYGITQSESLIYMLLAVGVSSIFYFIVAGIIKIFSIEKVLKLFPPAVTSSIIIAIGLTLAGTSITNCSQNWIIALTASIVIIICSNLSKGFLKIMPVLTGILVSFLVAICMGKVDFSSIKDAPWFGLPIKHENTVFALTSFNSSVFWTYFLMVTPITIASVMEHIGDICAISSTTGINYLADPGLNRTLMGDGFATFIATLFGAPANTTYSENTGTLSITRVFDPLIVRIAAVLAILLSFSPKFSAVIHCIPAATIGGVSFILYGMISSVGIKNLVDNKIDFSLPRNSVLVSAIIILAVGVKYALNDELKICGIAMSGLALAGLVGIIVNLIFVLVDYIKAKNKK